MADTVRTSAELAVLLADNTTGDIGAQDLRDMLASLCPGHAEMFISATAATTPADTATYKDFAGTYTLTADPHRWDMATNGQIRYVGAATRTVILSANISVTSGGNNQIMHFRVAHNGTSIASSELERKHNTGTDVGSVSIHTRVKTMVTNDYLTIQLRNETSTATVTAQHLNVVVQDILS